MWKQFLRNYFNFTKKERKGIIIIVTLILGFILLPFFYPLFIKQKQYSYSDFKNEIAALNIQKNDSAKDNKYTQNFDNEFYDDHSLSEEKKYETKAEVFYFDPNTISPADWKRLGLRDKTIHTIQNYLSKGGKFYKPEDISKIWALSPSDARRLIPYVSIKNSKKEYTSFEKKEYSKTTSSYTAKAIQPVDLTFVRVLLF